MVRLFEKFNRRRFLQTSALAGVGAIAGMSPLSRAFASSTLNFADIGVGDPGDWSRYTKASGYHVNLVAIGNAPSAILNVLIAGGGRQIYDVINIVGGMQKPLVEVDLIDEIDTGRIPNWSKNTYLQRYLAPGTPGFDFMGYQGKVYGVPTILQGDSFAYLPEITGPLDSYGAMFDPKFKGYVALEDNFTTTGQKTALYLKKSGMASIDDPADMSPSELKTVIDFLIEKKREGQFRVIWTGFEQAVSLLTSREVYVMDAWEPMVFVARAQGTNAEYARPKEGYLLWAMVAYIVNNPDRPEKTTQAAYDFLNFLLGPWYGAQITLTRGYMTNPDSVAYAANSGEFSAEDAKKIAEIDANVKSKFELDGTWQNRWPTHIRQYESEWARFKAA